MDVACIVCKFHSVKSRLDLSELEFLVFDKIECFPHLLLLHLLHLSGHKQLSLSQVNAKND